GPLPLPRMAKGGIRGGHTFYQIGIAVKGSLPANVLPHQLPELVIVVLRDQLDRRAEYSLFLGEQPPHVVIGKMVVYVQYRPARFVVLGMGLQHPARDGVQLALEDVPGTEIFVIAAPIDRTSPAVIGGKRGRPFGGRLPQNTYPRVGGKSMDGRNGRGVVGRMLIVDTRRDR